MQEQNFVLITQPGKSPVKKSPMSATAHHVVQLLDECLERTEAEQEVRTVCIIDEWGKFDAWAEKPFRTIFDTND